MSGDETAMSNREPNDADKKAAHEFLSELRTRIATQPLPYQHGIEERALESLWELFGHARAAMKENPGCQIFAAAVTHVLNVDVRALTAKWHRAKIEGRLASHDGADEFRGDLETLQARLREFSAQLQAMAYGEVVSDAVTPPALSEDELIACFKPVAFKLHKESILDPQAAADIQQFENSAILARRAGGQSPSESDAPENVVGLALSGGGIRSATFCLGVTQVLAERKLLGNVDILSTVSGGGYTGAFLAKALDEHGDQAAVACPHGPDPNAIRALRLNAKFLSATNLKESWGRVTATLAGLLLNWTAPLFIVAAVALAAGLLSCEEADVFGFFKATAIATGLSLLLYAIAMRVNARVSAVAGWLLAAASAVMLSVGIVWLAMKGYGVISTRLYLKVSIPTLAVLSAMVPMLLRLLPLLKTEAARAIALKVALYAAGLLIPFAGLFAIYFFYGLAQQESIPILGFTLHGNVIVLSIAVLSAIVSILFLNINATSLHRLYRDGLARTFLADRRIPIKDMNPSGRAPYHLINATLNLPSSENIALRDRRADFFLMSKYFCGSPAAKYVMTEKWGMDGRPLDVATGIAISGAAVSPHMGLGAMPTLTALLAFLNVRLGFWLRRPDEGALGRLGTSWPGFLCLLREMTGIGMSERRSWLNVSDGGHIENLAVYELLRRRCKFIISIDGEADASFTFQGLMTLVRHARIDLGVRIEPGLDELRADSVTSLCKRHAMLCRVHYPREDGGEDIGLLLYLKLSVTGNESELIKRYRLLHPAFPHQSTLDQFFDEEQFEAYRQLGVHVAEGLFTPAVTNDNTRPLSVEEWFESLARNFLEPVRR